MKAVYRADAEIARDELNCMPRVRVKGHVITYSLSQKLYLTDAARGGLARGALGATPKNSSPKGFADLIATDIKKWREVAEKGGIERI